MKKALYLIAAVFVLSATNAMAHCGMCALDKKGSMSIEDKVAKKMEKMTAELNLTEKQIPQVKSILTKKMEAKKAAKAEKKEAMDAIHANFSADMKALLDEEQNAKFDAMMAEWKKKGEKCEHCAKGSKGSGHDHKGSDHEHKGSAM